MFDWLKSLFGSKKQDNVDENVKQYKADLALIKNSITNVKDNLYKIELQLKHIRKISHAGDILDNKRVLGNIKSRYQSAMHEMKIIETELQKAENDLYVSQLKL